MPGSFQDWLAAPEDGFQFVAHLCGRSTPLIDERHDMLGAVGVDRDGHVAASGCERIERFVGVMVQGGQVTDETSPASSLGSPVCEVEVDTVTGQPRLAERTIAPERMLTTLVEERGEGQGSR